MCVSYMELEGVYIGLYVCVCVCVACSAIVQVVSREWCSGTCRVRTGPRNTVTERGTLHVCMCVYVCVCVNISTYGRRLPTQT